MKGERREQRGEERAGHITEGRRRVGKDFFVRTKTKGVGEGEWGR